MTTASFSATTPSPLCVPPNPSLASARYSELRQQLVREHPFLTQPAKSPELADTQVWSEEQGNASKARPDSTRDAATVTSLNDAAIALTEPRSARQHAFGPAYVPEEQTMRPDHLWNYSASGFKDLPANAVRNRKLDGRFTEYPKLHRLLEVKRGLVDASASPATYLGTDLRDSLGPPPGNAQRSGAADGGPFHLASLMPVKYDVVLIDAPLPCYEWDSIPSSTSTHDDQTWSWEDLEELPIPLLAAKESFVFLWVGPGCSDGLERGRATLSRWGYRRCEVITWCLASDDGNTAKPVPSTGTGDGLLASSAVHLLVGIRGTVKRNQDSNFVHCNIDTDVLFWPGEARENSSPLTSDSVRPIDLRLKPPELYTIIENFCLGTRRVELFGTNRNLRRGWLTIGLPSTLGPGAPGWESVLRNENAGAIHTHRKTEEPPEEYIKDRYLSHFNVDPVGCPLSMRSNVVPSNDVVEALRPRTPPQQQIHSTSAKPDASYHLDHSLTGNTNAPESNPSRAVGPSYPRGLGASYQAPHAGPIIPGAARPASLAPRGFSSPSLQHAKSPTSGLGAGGPVTVSLQSGSERLSGPQRSAVGLGMATGGTAGQGRGGRGSGGGGRGPRGARSDRGSGRIGKGSDSGPASGEAKT
ncbi:MT-A70-domain-containing protein [Microstroma glucosiphilum]|uniref:MT-A70-domain-containing protein n=1 Tax=Pseudomicrostroma glucosiphilum TaxID=1684307 RepID=A0A316U8Z6_9BASI|nr:MT-A70-domain-containing protein [Pseudomicrostroma glucosiphilum]PWN20931.1 MT-A70-domain-containing protein [Pseudomicrostroma glucosiphilum]